MNDQIQKAFDDKYAEIGEEVWHDLGNDRIFYYGWKACEAAMQSQAQQEPEKCVQCGVSVDNGHCLGGIWNCSAMQSQAQQTEYTFDQLTKMLMQAATKEGHKVTLKIKWAQPPAPEGE